MTFNNSDKLSQLEKSLSIKLIEKENLIKHTKPELENKAIEKINTIFNILLNKYPNSITHTTKITDSLSIIFIKKVICVSTRSESSLVVINYNDSGQRQYTFDPNYIHKSIDNKGVLLAPNSKVINDVASNISDIQSKLEKSTIDVLQSAISSVENEVLEHYSDIEILKEFLEE